MTVIRFDVSEGRHSGTMQYWAYRQADCNRGVYSGDMGLAALRLEVLSLLHVYLMGTDTSVCNVMQEDAFCKLGRWIKCALGGYSCPSGPLPARDENVTNWTLDKLQMWILLESFKVQPSSAYFSRKEEAGHCNHPEYWNWLRCNGI